MMRVWRVWRIVLALSAACGADFSLESRRFRCDPADRASCGEGWICAADGWCARPDGGPGSADAAATEICSNGFDDDGDARTDCQDEDCGVASCEGPCRESVTCNEDGSCAFSPASGNCGAGCVCSAGSPTEIGCMDGEDNDGDGAKDCTDADCQGCSGGLTCCPTGMCLPSC